MSRKFSSLESGEKSKLEGELDAVAYSQGIDPWSSTDGSSTLLESQIGVCASCKEMSYCKSEFGNVYAKCASFKMRLDGQNKMIECNEHSPRGRMSLNDMYAIATLIDPSDPEVKGFISRDARLMKCPDIGRERAEAGFTSMKTEADFKG